MAAPYPVDEPPAPMATPAGWGTYPEDEPMAPMAPPRTLSGGTPADYFAGMQQGLTGSALAERAGIATPQGMSPPDVYPRPVAPPGPNKWIGAVQPTGNETEDLLGQVYNNLQSMPVDQARQAIAMATYFQGVRGYQKWLEEGNDPEEGISRFGPMIFGGGGAGVGRGSGIAGLAALNRLNQPRSTWEFVEGQGAEPDAYKDLTGGKQPKIVPYKPKYLVEGGRTVGTIDDTSMVKEEMFPGVYAVYRQGSKGFKVVKDSDAPLDIEQRSKIEELITRTAKNIDALRPGSQLYLDTMEKLKSLQEAVGAPTAAPTPGPSAGILAPNAPPAGGGLFPPAGATSPTGKRGKFNPATGKVEY